MLDDAIRVRWFWEVIIPKHIDDRFFTADVVLGHSEMPEPMKVVHWSTSPVL